MDYSKLFDLTDRVALVVGAGSGIGEASAHGLAAFGARVLCADVNAEAAQRVAHDIGARAVPLAMDIRSAESIAQALRDAPPIDVLVCTPSINIRKPLLAISDEEFDRVVNLNLRGTFLVMRFVARGMAERGRGSIIVFSSIRGDVVEPGQGVYAATKAGVRQLCRALAAELGPRNVRVNVIAPGVVETPLTAQIRNHPAWYRAYAEKSALGRWAQPSEMVGAVVFLASDASSYVTGSVVYVDGGWTAQDGRFSPPL
ncbi:MAG: SDR family NAD(P)-dependent oxidoreductase [Anaerolineae bacterium]|nr:SDR family oxidoreductase [Thermoflexales bacterium]MDW8292719.1 SDR family NAD(P)-dependent oxidoreductase [Anaerolineae bacterium]